MTPKSMWILAALAATAFANAAGADAPAWITESNANAQPLLEVMAKYNPETAAALGVDGHDGDVADLKPGNDTRFEADSERVAQALEAKLATATDTRWLLFYRINFDDKIASYLHGSAAIPTRSRA